MEVIKNWCLSILQKLKQLFLSTSGVDTNSNVELNNNSMNYHSNAVVGEENVESPIINVMPINRKANQVAETIRVHYRSDNSERINVRNFTQNQPNGTTPNLKNKIVNPKNEKKVIVNKKSKPKVCPICRTKGSIIHDAYEETVWKCKICGSIF